MFRRTQEDRARKDYRKMKKKKEEIITDAFDRKVGIFIMPQIDNPCGSAFEFDVKGVRYRVTLTEWRHNLYSARVEAETKHGYVTINRPADLICYGIMDVDNIED